MTDPNSTDAREGSGERSAERLSLSRRGSIAAVGALAALSGCSDDPDEPTDTGTASRGPGSITDPATNSAARPHDADRIVWRDATGVFHAHSPGGEVARGEDMRAVIQAALDSLTDGRTSKETVAVVSPGSVGPYPDDEISEIRIPSYTILDVPATIRVAEEGEESLFFLRAKNADHIDIPNLNLVGNPRYGLWLQSVSNVQLGDVNIEFENEAGAGGPLLGVRIDGYANGTGADEIVPCTDIQVDNVYVKNAGHHAFETADVKRIQVGKIIGDDPERAVCLLNATSDATVGQVVGKDPGDPAGYATFRVANRCADVTCGQVVSRGGVRGVFGVSGCRNTTVASVNIVGATQGVLIQDCPNFAIGGGVVRNCGSGVRIDSRSSAEYPPSEGVSVSNLRIFDDRDDPAMEYAVAETEGGRAGADTGHNRIVGCDVRGAGGGTPIRASADTTTVRDNYGGGIASGTVTLTSGESPAATVEGVSSRQETVPEVRAEPSDAPDASFAWESYAAWDAEGAAWNLVFDWKSDPGADLPLAYVVDQNRVLGGA